MLVDSVYKSDEVIKYLDLKPLPGEGGFYRETYRSNLIIEKTGKTRSIQTQIYYLVTEESFSVLHRLKNDEIYHYYGGGAAEILLISPNGKFSIEKLGNDLRNGEKPQILIPSNYWQGVRLLNSASNWSLMGTSVSPGFEFEDFELGNRLKLVSQYPENESLILKYTR
jgi:predicted cupin superfamily sugar epimerase